MTAWSTLLSSLRSRWAAFQYALWKRWREQRVEKREEELPLYFALDATLRKLRKLPAFSYDYRVGASLVLGMYFHTWSELLRGGDELCSAVAEWREVRLRALEISTSKEILSFDEFLDDEERCVDSQGAVATLGPFLDELVQHGLDIIEALRIAKASDDPGRFHYYQSRASRLLSDIETVATALEAKAMEPPL